MSNAPMPPWPIVHETEVDGVRTMWIDEPGPLVAALCFRVGRSDEPTPMSGISHIVEHLALAGLGVQDYEHNGMVDGQQTVFTNIGRPAEVVAFLSAVTRNLSDLPVERLLVERRILREERNQRGPSIGGAIRWYRFGYAGQGRALGPDDDELGLGWVGPEAVAAWARRWYTRQNAILWLSGPVPPDLRLTLPDGEPAGPPSIETTPEVTFPAHLPWDGPAATIGFTARRSAAINMATFIAHRRARQRLRFDDGLVYDVECEYEPIDPDTAHILFGADGPEERIGAIATALRDVLREMATSGPTQVELDNDVEAYIRQFDERDGRIAHLAVTAWDTLWGGETFTPEAFVAKRRAVTPESARAALAEALETTLVLAKCDPLPDLHLYPAWSASRVSGREVGPAGFFLPGRKPKERLLVAPDGLSVVAGPDQALTVRYADAVASVHHEPQVRHVLARDGTAIVVVAAAWKDGERIIDEIDAALPPGSVACDEHGIGALADPSPETGPTASGGT